MIFFELPKIIFIFDRIRALADVIHEDYKEVVDEIVSNLPNLQVEDEELKLAEKRKIDALRAKVNLFKCLKIIRKEKYANNINKFCET